jgi:hypothetical protein
VIFSEFSFDSLPRGDSANVVDSSFIQELSKNGFIDAVWKK